mgnify:CR=1 FL=1
MDFVLTVLVCVVSGLIAPEPAPRDSTLSAHAPAQVKLAQADPVALVRTAHEIDVRLTQLANEYRAFLDDPYLCIAVRYFGEAQSAATALVADGHAVPVEVNRLHVNLDEFARAMSQLEAGWTPNTAGLAKALKGKPQPSIKTGNELREKLAAVKKLANRQPDFEEVALVRLFDSSSATEAVMYGHRVLDAIDHVLYSRGLGQITDGGRAETTKALGPALKELRESLEQLVDANGGHVTPKDEKGTPLGDPLGRVRQALDAAEKKADIARNQLSHVRERVEVAQAGLKRLRENVLRVKVLRE